MIKVLIVDDSTLMRNILKDIIASNRKFTVVGYAKNGEEAIELNRLLKPDIITMDVEMPKMNGIEAVKRIMDDMPTRIVVVSAFTAEDATATFNALKNGAVDVIQKPSGVISTNLMSIKSIILEKLEQISTIPLEKIKQLNKQNLQKIEIKYNKTIEEKAIVIAASTGGPKALENLISSLPKRLNSFVFIVQHMPSSFTNSFAQRLNRVSEIDVKEVENGEKLKKDTVYIAKGDNHFKLDSDDNGLYAKLTKEPPLWGVRPAADYLFDSAARLFKNNLLGIVLTGMGKDATQGSQAIKQFNGKVIVQDKDSAFIWGMPGSVVHGGFADYEVNLKDLPLYIKKFIENEL